MSSHHVPQSHSHAACRVRRVVEVSYGWKEVPGLAAVSAGSHAEASARAPPASDERSVGTCERQLDLVDVPHYWRLR